MYSCHDDKDEGFLGEAAGHVLMIQDVSSLLIGCSSSLSLKTYLRVLET